jgi:hypothetical protein
MKTPPATAPRARQPAATSSSSEGVAIPYSTAWRPRLDDVVRSAYSSVHQPRSSAVAKVHVEVE